MREPLLRRLLFATTLHIAPEDAAPLAAAGLNTFDRLVGAPPEDGHRKALHVGLVRAGSRAYYLKRYAYGGWRILRTFGYRAKADREFENLRRVAEAGVPAARPAAWGVRRRLGFIPDSFLLTEEVEGAVDARVLLRDYREGRPAAVPREAFRDVLDRLVDGLRTLHERGLYLHTPFDKNILVRMRGGTAEYAWVDLPFAGHAPPGRLPVRRRVRDLACLHKGLETLLPAPDRLRLLKRYLGPGASRAALRDLAGRVLHHTRSLRDETPAARLVKALKGG